MRAVRGDGVRSVEPVGRSLDQLDERTRRGEELGDRIGGVVRHPDVRAVRGDGVGIVEPVGRRSITLTSAPVEARSSVTELPSTFATQTCVPSEAMATGPLNPSLCR